MIQSPCTGTHWTSTAARTKAATLPVTSQQGKQLAVHRQDLGASRCLFSPSLDGYSALPPSFACRHHHWLPLAVLESTNMIHHLPWSCKNTQKSASSFRTLNSLGDNPLSVHQSMVPHQMDLALPVLFQWPNSHVQHFTVHQMARGGFLPSLQSCHNTSNYLAAKPNPSKRPSLEACISSSAVCTTKVSKLLLPTR